MGWYTACPGFLFAACMTGVLLGRGLLVSWSGLGKDVLTGQFLREKAAAAAAGIKLSGACLGQPYRAVLLRIQPDHEDPFHFHPGGKAQVVLFCHRMPTAQISFAVDDFRLKAVGAVRGLRI